MPYIPLGYTQSAGSWPLNPNPHPLQLSIIGDPIPAAHYARTMGVSRAIFPDKYPPYRGNTGPLRASGG